MAEYKQRWPDFVEDVADSESEAIIKTTKKICNSNDLNLNSHH